MKKTQSGVSLVALIMGLAILVIAGIFSMKLVPAYIEFYNAKAAIVAIAKEKQGASAAEMRKSFDARATIDDINSIKSADLQIDKQGISFAYRKEVPLGGNVSLVIDFAASSGGD